MRVPQPHLHSPQSQDHRIALASPLSCSSPFTLRHPRPSPRPALDPRSTPAHIDTTRILYCSRTEPRIPQGTHGGLTLDHMAAGNLQWSMELQKEQAMLNFTELAHSYDLNEVPWMPAGAPQVARLTLLSPTLQIEKRSCNRSTKCACRQQSCSGGAHLPLCR